MSGPWFKCFPRDFNEGMVGLTLEERGAYITLLNLIYARSGPIPEDAWWITSQLGCTTRAWVKIRAALIVKGKLAAEEIDGRPHLMNARARAEIEARQKASEEFSDAGKRGGRPAKSKTNKNNGLEKPALSAPKGSEKRYQISEADKIDDDESARAPVIPIVHEQADDWPDGDCAALLVASAASPWLDPQKHSTLVLTAGRLAAWKREGLSWGRVVLPVVTEIARKARSPIRSWTYFDNAMAAAAAASRQALEIPEQPNAQPRQPSRPDQRSADYRDRLSRIDAAMGAAVE